METNNGAGTKPAAGSGNGDDADSDIYAVFESLEQLREAQAREAVVPPPAKQADDSSLEAVLTHYKDWLRTIDS